MVDIEEALADPQTSAVLEAWATARNHETSPPFSGGVLDAWPAMLADGLAVCRQEETAIRDFLRWKEEHRGPEPSAPG